MTTTQSMMGFASNLRNIARSSPFYTPIHKFRLEQLTRSPGTYPDWRQLLAPCMDEWHACLASTHGPRILIATNLGLHFTANAIDSLVAVALTFRGAKVDFLLCDGALPACQMVDHVSAPSVARYAKRGPQPSFCDPCFSAGLRNYTATGLPIQRLSKYLTDDDHVKAQAFGELRVKENLNPTETEGIIEHGYAGSLRFFGRATLPDNAQSRGVLSRYLASAYLSHAASVRMMTRENYDIVIAHHGIYTPQGPLADAARNSHARLITWHPAYRKGRLIFEHGDTYHRAMLEEPRERWAEKALSHAEDEALSKYLDSRATGSMDWISFQRSSPQTKADLENLLGLSFDIPTMILIGNVAWDARLHYKSSAYGDMTAWATDTVKWYADHPDQQLIVRCHPGEHMSSPRAQDRLDEVVRSALPTLPPNIKIIPPESDLNTYAVARHCRSALIYNTKMGVELTARGMPVIVAGDAWIRGKGLSEDASDPEGYAAILKRAPDLPQLNETQLTLARRYAFHFFFRRCIPVSAFDREQAWPLCALAQDAGLLARKGVDAGLNIICDGILQNKPFEYDGELNTSQT